MSREKVGTSAKVLDKMIPEWPTVIDLDMLDMSSINDCLLVQIGAHLLVQIGDATFPDDRWDRGSYTGMHDWAHHVGALMVAEGDFDGYARMHEAIEESFSDNGDLPFWRTEIEARLALV